MHEIEFCQLLEVNRSQLKCTDSGKMIKRSPGIFALGKIISQGSREGIGIFFGQSRPITQRNYFPECPWMGEIAIADGTGLNVFRTIIFGLPLIDTGYIFPDSEGSSRKRKIDSGFEKKYRQFNHFRPKESFFPCWTQQFRRPVWR